MSVIQALLIALFVAAIESRALGYATLTMRFSPLMTGMDIIGEPIDIAGTYKTKAD